MFFYILFYAGVRSKKRNIRPAFKKHISFKIRNFFQDAQFFKVFYQLPCRFIGDMEMQSRFIDINDGLSVKKVHDLPCIFRLSAHAHDFSVKVIFQRQNVFEGFLAV